MMPVPNLFPANSSSFREARLAWNVAGGGEIQWKQVVDAMVPQEVQQRNANVIYRWPQQYDAAQQRARSIEGMMRGQRPDALRDMGRNLFSALGSALTRLGDYIRRSKAEAAQRNRLVSQQQALNTGSTAPAIPETIPTTEQEMRARIETFNKNPNREMTLTLEGTGPYTLSWNTVDIPRERVDHESVQKRVNALGFPEGTYDHDRLTLSNISLLQVHQTVLALRPAPAQTPAQQAAAKTGTEQQAKTDAERPASRSPFTPQETQAIRIERFNFGWRQGFVETAIRNLPADKRANVVQALSRITSNEPAVGELMVAMNGLPRDQRAALATIPAAQLRDILRNPAANPAGLTALRTQAATAALVLVRNSPARVTAVQNNVEPMLELIQNM